MNCAVGAVCLQCTVLAALLRPISYYERLHRSELKELRDIDLQAVESPPQLSSENSLENSEENLMVKSHEETTTADEFDTSDVRRRNSEVHIHLYTCILDQVLSILPGLEAIGVFPFDWSHWSSQGEATPIQAKWIKLDLHVVSYATWTKLYSLEKWQCTKGINIANSLQQRHCSSV